MLAQKPTGAVIVPLQLILKSSPNEARITADGVNDYSVQCMEGFKNYPLFEYIGGKYPFIPGSGVR